MAFSKVILNGDVLMDVTSDTVAANNLLSGETATGASGLRVTGAVTVPTKTSDLTNDGDDGTSPFATEDYVDGAVPSTYVSSFNGSSGAVTYTAPVTSVNTKTGAVSLTASDVGALPDSTVIPPEVTESTVAGWGFTKNTGTYSKPSGGIPASDLAAAVQTSLGKADTALQSAPVTSVNTKTGAVVLSASDIGAYTKPSGGIPKTDLASAVQTSLGKADTALQSAPVASVNGQTGAVVLTASDVGAGTYSKPSGGIPSSDLSSAVQTSLGKADTALQSAPVTSVNGQTGAVSISIPAATSDLTNDSGFITSSDLPPDWFSLGTKITSGDLDNYQTAGRYFCEASDAPNIAHKPTDSAFALYVAYIYNQWRPFQLAFDFDARFYVRVLTGNGWTGWTTSYPLLNATTQTTAGVYALDAAVGKALADAISALTTAVQDKESLVGDTAIPSAANLNSYTTLGTFYASSNSIASSLSNCPVTVACKLVVEGGTSPSNVPGHLRQTVTPYNAQDIYIRTSINSGSSWSAWKKVTLANA